ncbi:hypothetical protein GCM10027046_22110 [Uliginosibacterium flavum]
MFDVMGRRSGEAAKGTHKRSLSVVPLDARHIAKACNTPMQQMIVQWYTPFFQEWKFYRRAFLTTLCGIGMSRDL